MMNGHSLSPSLRSCCWLVASVKGLLSIVLMGKLNGGNSSLAILRMAWPREDDACSHGFPTCWCGYTERMFPLSLLWVFGRSSDVVVGWFGFACTF